jgi:hypothetical protein
VAAEPITASVVIREDGRTRVMIVHSGLPESEALKRAAGWRHLLGRLVTTARAGPGDGRAGQ